jgi:hypothetical protein
VWHAKGRWVLAFMVSALSACGSGADVPRRLTEPPHDSYSVSVFQVRIDGNTEALDGATVSPDFFNAAQARPLVGRFFVDGDYRAKTPVVVLTHEFWQRRLQGAPQVIGTALTVNDRPVTVIGVAERGFAVPNGAQMWLPKIEQ